MSRVRQCGITASLALLALLITACDAAAKLKGRVVDESGNPRENCTVVVKYRDESIGEFRVSGAFEETLVFRPVTPEPLIVHVACKGAGQSYETRVSRMPANLGSPIDLGTIVLP